MLRIIPATFALALGAIACAHTRVSPRADCPPPPDHLAATAFDTARVAELAGVYELVTINTARGYGGHTTRERLVLTVPDSAHRHTDRYGIGQPRRVPRPLAGAVIRRTDGREWRDTAEVVGRTMTVGLVMGNDVSPTHYGIVAVDAGGFAGRWENAMAGNVLVVDDDGRPFPKPAGHFCARLLSPHP